MFVNFERNGPNKETYIVIGKPKGISMKNIINIYAL